VLLQYRLDLLELLQGKVLEYNKNNTKETNCSYKIPISTNVGENIVHDEGK
jgi:hypothetical protein